MKEFDEKFAPFAERMHAEGLPEIVINNFKYYYTHLVKGQTGFMCESDIRPVETLPDVKTIPNSLAEVGQAALPKTVYLKLNGGLGTSMGLEQAKSSIIAREGLTFLDIICRYTLHNNLLLLLMNSFVTEASSLAIMKKYSELRADKTHIPLDFLQHKVPKVSQGDFSPVTWPQNPDLEWCPPGHGDIFLALVTSGMLDNLVNSGYEYAFVSNSDNLGASLDTTILGHFIKNQIPFMVEVAERTEADRKGGHLAQLPNGQFIIRELAQCPTEDLPAYQDIIRHKYFNTNSYWLHLPTIKDLLYRRNYILGLSLIRNAKTVDPRDSSSTPVYQLETAMGSAIAVIEGSSAICVPRTRFIPIKNTNDLVMLRSDAYKLTNDYRVIENPARKLKRLVIDLDPTYYKITDDMEARFPKGVPSLIDCEEFRIKGDIKFGQNIKLKGKVSLVNSSDSQKVIADDAIISGSH